MKRALLFCAPAVAAGLLLSACGGGNGGNDSGGTPPAPSPGGPAPAPGPSPSPGPGVANVKPSYLGTVKVTEYDGASDDLLTAGLGWDGLQAATAPTVSATPTAAELRRLAIYNNYRALVDMTAAGGYGSFFGPNVPLTGAPTTTAGAGKIAGTEFIAVSDDGTGRRNVTMMVQVPANFDRNNPCIITAPSSGSRGVYGAISLGEWGLKRRCAVAYTDKGTGNGAHELATDTVTTIDGTPANAQAAGSTSQFTANLNGVAPTALPNRYAFKHAHSQQNPEKDWGLFTLQSIEFAFYAINERFGDVSGTVRQQTFVPANTLVIAAGVSNGGGAALRAAEQDTAGLIDAVVVAEPQVNVTLPADLRIRRGGRLLNTQTATTGPEFARPLYDYVTVANQFQPCAAYAPAAAGSPLQALVTNTTTQPFAANRCQALANQGLLGTPAPTTFEAQATAALDALHRGGWEPESDLLHASHFGLQATTGVAVTYANAYTRASVSERVCDFSFGATDPTTGLLTAPATSPMATIFATGNGIPPTAGINILYNADPRGPINHMLGTDNFSYEGAQCLRGLWRVARAGGADPNSLAGRLSTGINEVLASGNLRGKPAIIVHGRSDALVPVNHSSRTYFGANQIAEGATSQLRYVEVTNAQHFDAFLGLPGFGERFVPMHWYATQALNLMWDHMKTNAPLPASQVVRTTPRGDGARALAATNVPAIAATPAAGDAITFSANIVDVPN